MSNVAAPPSAGAFSVQTAPLSINGQTLAGGVGINYDLGPSVAGQTAQAFSFINQQNQMDQAFLGQTITQGQNYFQAQTTPITAGIAQAVQASAAAQPSVNQAILATFQGSSPQPGGGAGGFASTLLSSFSSLIKRLSNTQAQLSNNSLAIIQSNNQASIASSNASAHSGGGGGGCYITTAICELEDKPDDCDELRALRAWRDQVLCRIEGGRDLIARYYREAPAIVAGIMARADRRQVLEHLRAAFLNDALIAVRNGQDEAALGIYCRMCDFARRYAETHAS